MVLGLSSRNAASFVAGALTALSALLVYRWTTWEPQDTRVVKPTYSKRKKVLFFGDSITQHGYNTEISGWVAKFAHWWSRRVDVVNRGFSGYNSKWARQIVDKVVAPHDPDLVFVFFGANDAVDASVLQHVPLADYEENIQFVVLRLREMLPHASIVLITPPPIWEEKLQFFNKNKGKPLLIDRTNERTLLYVQACLRVGKQFGLPVVDAWSAMEGFSGSRGDYLSDGLHLSAKGCSALFEAAKEVVLENFPAFNPDVMEMDLPDWSRFESRGV